MFTGVWIPLEPRVSFKIQSGIEVTVFCVAAATAPKDAVLEDQGAMQGTASPAQPARGKPALRNDYLGTGHLHLVGKLAPKLPEARVAHHPRPFAAPHHPLDVQVFDNDVPIGAHQAGRQLWRPDRGILLLAWRPWPDCWNRQLGGAACGLAGQGASVSSAAASALLRWFRR